MEWEEMKKLLAQASSSEGSLTYLWLRNPRPIVKLFFFFTLSLWLGFFKDMQVLRRTKRSQTGYRTVFPTGGVDLSCRQIQQRVKRGKVWSTSTFLLSMAPSRQLRLVEHWIRRQKQAVTGQMCYAFSWVFPSAGLVAGPAARAQAMPWGGSDTPWPPSPYHSLAIPHPGTWNKLHSQHGEQNTPSSLKSILWQCHQPIIKCLNRGNYQLWLSVTKGFLRSKIFWVSQYRWGSRKYLSFSLAWC